MLAARRQILAVCVVVLVLSSTDVAHAVKFWKNGVVTGNWNVSNNWSAVSAAGGDNGRGAVNHSLGMVSSSADWDLIAG